MPDIDDIWDEDAQAEIDGNDFSYDPAMSEARKMMTDAMDRTPFFLSHGIEVAFSLPATEGTMFEPLTFTLVDKKQGT